MRVLKLFGSDASSVKTTVGPEQEYFLIPKELFDKRKDLIYTGRTLFGAMPSKGQELDDHYFGSIKPRVHAFMKDLDRELWKLGVLAKNLTDEDYSTFYFESLGNGFMQKGKPLQIGADLKWTF
jgi:glutamine synthetase